MKTGGDSADQLAIGDMPACWKHRRLLLGVLLLLAFSVRVYGIGWGLPGRVDMHPDEHDYVMTHALKVSFAHPDPVFLNYPSFLMYLVSLSFGGLTQLGLIQGETWQAYVVGRLWSALFATLTILPVYRIAREMGGSVRAGLWAGFFVAILPLHVWESHAAVTDPLMTFWVMMTLWASMRLVRTGRLRDYLFAGACLGLATGSKYTAALSVVAILAAAIVSGRPRWATLGGLAAAAVASLLCAFVVAPFSFIRIHDTLAAMAYEHHHVQGHHYGFSLPANGWQYHRYLYQLVAAWPFSFGFALYACAVAGTLHVLRRLNRRSLPLFVFAAVFFGITGSWTFVPLRYYLPLVVLGALFAGVGLAHWLERDGTRRVARTVAALVVAYTCMFTGQTTARYGHETRDEARSWLDEHLRPGGRLVLAGWFRYLALPSAPERYKMDFRATESVLAHVSDDSNCDLIEVSSLLYQRHYRQGNEGMIGTYNRVRKSSGPFELVARFDTQFINKRLYMKLDPLFGGYFVSPTLEFYHAKHPRPTDPHPKMHG